MGFDRLMYFGQLTEKKTRQYTKKDGTQGIGYDLNFTYMGGYVNIGCDSETFNRLKEGDSYALPVGVRSFKNSDFVSYFVRTNDGLPVYVVDENEEYIAI